MATPTNSFVFVDPYSGESFDTQVDLSEIVKTTGVLMRCPVKLGLRRDGSDLWTLPLEPLVSVKGSKTIVRRNIAKHPTGSNTATLTMQATLNVPFGTVKELWSQDDYEIEVSGLLQSSELEQFPAADLGRLQGLLKAGQSLVFRSVLTDLLGLDRLAVMSWDFPATAGVENQEYRFTGYSDYDFELS